MNAGVGGFGRRRLGCVGQRQRTSPHPERSNSQKVSAGKPVTVSSMVLTENCQHFKFSRKAKTSSD